MQHSLDSLAAAHRAAAVRRAAGRPIWDRKIRLGDVFHNGAMTFAERRDAIVDRLRRSGWPGQNDNIAALLVDLAEAQDAEKFDPIWDEVYDEADLDRVWIETNSQPRPRA